MDESNALTKLHISVPVWLKNVLQEAAEEKGMDLDYEQAREIVYGEPYADWKAKHQTEASAEQKAAFDGQPKH